MQKILIMSANRLIHLDFLRALAIISVLFFHLGFDLFKYGFLGVDIFFILSGFLMYKYFQQEFNKKRILKYYLNRAFRVIPLYLIANLIVLLISFFYLISPHELYIIIKHYFFSSYFLPNIGYWSEESYFGSTTLKPLLNFWSLGVEIQYYLIFPLIFLFLKNRFNTKIFILFFLSLTGYIIFNSISPKTSFFLLPTRLWEFLLGIYCAKYFKKFNKNKTNIIGSISFILILLFIIFLSFEQFYILEKNYYLFTIIIAIFTSIILIYGINKNLIEDFLLKKIFLTISKYSYSLYVVHFPIIVFINYYPFKGNITHFQNSLYMFFTIALIIIVTVASYHLVEDKFRRNTNYKTLIYIIFLNCIISTFLFISIKNIYKIFMNESKYNISFASHDKEKFRCGKIYKLLKFNNQTCLISKKKISNKNILLFGDSQADSIKLQLIKSSENINYNLRLYDENLKLNSQHSLKKLLKEINKNNYQAIIFHSYPGNIDLEIIERLLLMNEYNDIKFIYIMSPPIYKNSVPLKLFSEYVLKKSKLKRKTYSEHRSEQIEEYDQVEKLKLYKNFYSADIAKEICNLPVMMKDKRKYFCRIMSENFEPFYYDNHHFTNTGAFQLDKVLQKLFYKLLD